jgi:endoglucanase
MRGRGGNVRPSGGRSSRYYYAGKHSRGRRFPLLLIALLFLAAAAAAVLTAVRSQAAAGAGYWHTSGTEILDENDRHVRISGVTWYGMESSYWVPAGLDYQPYTKIMDLVKSLGYNAIRLPFSNELVESNPIVTDKVAANPQFKGRHALDVLDSIVAYAHKISLKIILDDHRCRASRPKTVNFLDEPLWYTSQYPESSWINDWVGLARRYLHDDAVIGFDLRNEPHTDGPGPWTVQAYINQGATWGPTNGVDNPATDWHLAAERGGNAVLAVNPHLLMFVEGVQLYPDASQSDGVDAYWWGSTLTGVRDFPVILNVPHQLVYSPHDWGPWKWNFPWFPQMTYASIQKVWHVHWSFIVQDPNAPYAAPVWIGEFGTCTNNPKCIDVQRPGNQATWFQFFLHYLRDNPNVGWSFFALNGSNSNDHAAFNGVTNPHWSTTASSKLQSYLAGVQG